MELRQGLLYGPYTIMGCCKGSYNGYCALVAALFLGVWHISGLELQSSKEVEAQGTGGFAIVYTYTYIYMHIYYIYVHMIADV